MALTVKQLNNDASFLLVFEPIEAAPTGLFAPPEPFRVLVDPCDVAPPKASLASYVLEACASPLRQVPQPDVIVISNARSDHCNEATLRHFASSGTKTLILAEPAAARVIRSWKYFDRDKVRTIEAWRDPRAQASNRRRVLRIPVPAAWPGGRSGEVTVTLMIRLASLGRGPSLCRGFWSFRS